MAGLIGVLVAACPAVPYGMLHTKRLEREKMKALIINDQDFDQKMFVSDCLNDDLNWWLNKVPGVKNPVRLFNFKKEFFSDDSLSGWGAYYNKISTQGFWSVQERKLAINHLELIAAFLALKCFAKEDKDCEILLRIDNTTAIAYINRMGGVQYPQLNKLARDIWNWCEERKIWVFASYIPSKENTDADRESSRSNVDTEWELGFSFFDNIVEKWGWPDIDLFASRNNAKVSTFCAWKRDPDALFIDAFTLNWKKHFFYAFPPFSVIARVLQKIQLEKTVGILVVPLWPTQPWFPLFKLMLIDEPITFLPASDLLLSPCRSLKHPLAEKLTLIAGKLSGEHISSNNYQKHL